MSTAANSLAAPHAGLPPGFDLLRLARSITHGLQHGRHRSLAKGGSAEFYDYRAYSPGDSTRLIDWRLVGRTDRVYLRRYQQETRIDLVLVLDASPSMRFGGLGPPGAMATTKLRRSCELGAAMAHLAIKGGDRVGLIISDGRAVRVVPTAGGWPALRALIAAFEKSLKPRPPRGVPSPAGSTAGSSPLAAGLDEAARLARAGGVVVALSDALDEAPPIVEAVARLRHAGTRLKRDIALLQVLSDDEVALPSIGAARLIDPETGRAVEADAEEVAAAYGERLRAHIRSVRGAVIGSGGRHVLAPLSRSPVDVLRELLGH